ncbi:hypothetical protein ABZ027_36760 [Streptomyces sp. NPDC006332]|uniref:hypothetical protein n=1 Tax=Streptomyces sp. NPDC006332 TaxID=3155456 RepID=UPI0033A782A1
MPTTASRPVLGVTALAVLLAVNTGCSADPGQSGSDSKVLEGLAALAHGNSANLVTYLDAAKAQELSKGNRIRVGSFGQPASGLLNTHEPPPWGEALKVTQIDTAVDTNTAGHWEGSFDASAITASLKSNGYKQSADGETWTRSGSKGVVMSLKISNDEISYTARDASMAAVTPKDGNSLADKKEYRRVAECLGEVYRADFLPLTPAKPVHLSAVGQQAASAAKNTEVLCAVAKDDATADRAAAKLRSVVADESPKFDGTEVTVEKGDQPIVRAAVPDTGTQRPGRLMISNMELLMAVISSDL